MGADMPSAAARLSHGRPPPERLDDERVNPSNRQHVGAAQPIMDLHHGGDDIAWPPAAALLQHRYANVEKRWLRNFGQDDEWNFCLTTGTLVPANQERP